MEVVPAPLTGTAGAPGTPDTVGTAWLVPLLVLVVGMFMSVLDISIVNVAIPTIQRDFGSSTDDIQWISTAYTLALGVVVPLSGWLGDRLGLAKTYLYGLIAFALASALCGLAWDLNSMIAFRILQAVPGGIIPVVTMTMVYEVVPREKIGSAMGLYGLGIIFGPAIGPTLGGYLVEYVSWRLIFFINVPVGVLGAVAVALLLPSMPPSVRRPMDWWGFITVAAGFFALLLACSEAPSWRWDSYKVEILLVFGVLMLALFVVIELELDEPLIDLRVLKTWMFTNSLLLISILSVGLYAVLFYLPLFMQESQNLQPLHTGLILLPEALTMAVTMPIAGKLYDLFGPRWPSVCGLTIAAFGGFLLCQISPEMSTGDVILWTCVRAAGNGLAMMPIFTAGLAAIPREYASSGSSVNNIAQRVSAAFGLAGMTALATNQQNQLMADRSALIQHGSSLPAVRTFAEQGVSGLLSYHQQLQIKVTAQAYSNTFLVAAWLTVVGIGLAFLMKPPKPAATTPATEPPATADIASAEVLGSAPAEPADRIPADTPLSIGAPRV
jgi:EmrB/QacA subfamily drug resistance transporter